MARYLYFQLHLWCQIALTLTYTLISSVSVLFSICQTSINMIVSDFLFLWMWWYEVEANFCFCLYFPN